MHAISQLKSHGPIPTKECSPRCANITHEARIQLRRSSYLAMRGVSCEVQAGTARLHGRLSTYFLKQVAQTIVAGVEGVRMVANQIEVVASSPRS